MIDPIGISVRYQQYPYLVVYEVVSFQPDSISLLLDPTNASSLLQVTFAEWVSLCLTRREPYLWYWSRMDILMEHLPISAQLKHFWIEIPAMS